MRELRLRLFGFGDIVTRADIERREASVEAERAYLRKALITDAQQLIAADLTALTREEKPNG